jgi:hypothetical protein
MATEEESPDCPPTAKKFVPLGMSQMFRLKLLYEYGAITRKGAKRLFWPLLSSLVVYERRFTTLARASRI